MSNSDRTSCYVCIWNSISLRFPQCVYINIFRNWYYLILKDLKGKVIFFEKKLHMKCVCLKAFYFLNMWILCCYLFYFILVANLLNEFLKEIVYFHIHFQKSKRIRNVENQNYFLKQFSKKGFINININIDVSTYKHM